MTEEARTFQLETMRIYRALTARREGWGGKLVLLCGLRSSHAGAAAAVSIAGGTTLVLDTEATAIKAAQRAGHLDFVVHSLDEALRALKNEVRQKRALGVGLIADIHVTLVEMEQRGIQPDLRLDLQPVEDLRSGDEFFFSAKDAAALRAIDAALFTGLPAEDSIRHLWLQRAPQFLHEARAGGRWIWLRDTELAAVAAKGITPAKLP